MWKKNLLKEEKTFVQSVSRKATVLLLMFVVYKVVGTFILNEDPSPGEIVLCFVDIGVAYLAVIFAVDKPGVGKLVKTVRTALVDGKLTKDEAFAILREAFYLLVGFWADQTQKFKIVEKNEEVNLPEKIDITHLSHQE